MKPHSTQPSGLIFIREKAFYSAESIEMANTNSLDDTVSIIYKGAKGTSDISLNGDFVNLKK